MIRNQFESDNLDSSTKLWRYMDHIGAIDFITNLKLRFTQLAEFEDISEGQMSKAEIEDRIKQEKALGSRPTNPDVASSLHNLYNRHFNYASCWTTKDPNSMLMWSIYAPNKDSVAIETTVGKLKLAAGEKDPEVLIGKIKYGDREFGILDSFNSLNAIWAKWDYYEHEEEIRLLTDGMRLGWSHPTRPICEEPKYAFVQFEDNPVSNIYASPRMSEESFRVISEVINKTSTGLVLEKTKIKLTT